MFYSFARVSAVLKLKVDDYYHNGARRRLRLHDSGSPARGKRDNRVLDRDRQRFKSSSASSGTAGVAAVVFLEPRISRYSKNSSIVINVVDFIVISMCFPLRKEACRTGTINCPGSL
jgi:hypothetical protein